MGLLSGLRVVQLGGGLAASVCGRLLADVGADVLCTDPDRSTPLAQFLNDGKNSVSAGEARAAVARAELIVCEGRPDELRVRQHDAGALRRLNDTAALVHISPFGQTGPRADDPATDLTLFFASGIARLLTGQVDSLDEAPIRPVGEQAAFIGGLAAACAGMHAALGRVPATIDVAVAEALATMAIGELANAGLGAKIRPRRRVADGNGATVTILPARDGYVAISPREDRQWAAWLEVMGAPDWGEDPRFATKPDRVVNWDALHALMSAWSRRHDKQWIADRAQAAHVPSFPLREPAEQFASAQLAHRRFWRPVEIDGRIVEAPGAPFGIEIAHREHATVERVTGAKPLSGVRVLDFSWVIAGPTATRYLAAMGAEVIKIEMPGRGDPGRASELHTVLGQAKRGIVLDLKKQEAVETARALATRSDVLIENFATGVMERLGLGETALRALHPRLIYVSASGLGRTGPEARAVAYGTLLQCYAGFAGLNRHPEIPPRVGFAWLDPMCGLMLAFVVAAALWQRQRGGVARIDFSMIEAMLWTMAEPLLQTQLGTPPRPRGNDCDRCAPHGAYRCAGPSPAPPGAPGEAAEADDDWLAVAVNDDRAWRRLCAIVPNLGHMAEYRRLERVRQHGPIDAALAAWLRPQPARTAAAALRQAGIPASRLAGALDLVASDHLRARGFWDRYRDGVVPGLPWRASLGRVHGPAPHLGADTDAILRDVLDLSEDRIAAMRRSGALG